MDTDTLNRCRKEYVERLFARDDVSEVVNVMDDTAILAIVHLRAGGYRVAKIVPYFNRRGNPQISMYFRDFEKLDDAETLYLEVLEYNGFLHFGDELRINKSGMTVHEDPSDPYPYTVIDTRGD